MEYVVALLQVPPASVPRWHIISVRRGRSDIAIVGDDRDDTPPAAPAVTVAEALKGARMRIRHFATSQFFPATEQEHVY